MKTLSVERSGRVVLTAPVSGVARLCAPRTLCGELEVFRCGDLIATITSAAGEEEVAAPGDGFLLRVHIADGALVTSGAPLVIFSVTG